VVGSFLILTRKYTYMRMLSRANDAYEYYTCNYRDHLGWKLYVLCIHQFLDQVVFLMILDGLNTKMYANFQVIKMYAHFL
jgi:hypothetical protein